MSIKKAVSNSVIYIGFEALNKSLPFMLIPILTHYLTPEDMGLIAEFSAVLGVLYVLVGLSVHGAVNVAYFHIEKKELAVYVFNAMLVMFMSLIICMFFTWIFSEYFYYVSSISIKWLYICELVAALQFITLINLTLWQAEKKATAFGFYHFLQTSLNFILTIYFVIWLTTGWEGRLHAQVISAFSAAIISVYLLIKRGYIKVHFTPLYIKDTLSFGVPLVPHALSGWLFLGFNIMLISKQLGTDIAGVFSVAMQFSLIMNIIYQSANRAITPLLFEKLIGISGNDKTKIVTYTYIGFTIIAFLAVTGYAVSVIAIKLVVDERFRKAIEYLPYLFIYSMFNGFYLLVVNYIFFAKKTIILAIATGSTGLLHVIVSSLLVGKFGATGIAISLMFSTMLMFLFVWGVSSRVFPMPWSRDFFLSS